MFTFTKSPIYGFDIFGERTRILTAPTLTRQDCFPIGGRLYYVNPLGDGEYDFFKSDGTLVTEAQVATAFLTADSTLLDSLVAYRVKTVGTIDKYYAYYDNLYTSKRWTYYEDGAYVYNSLSVGDGIGKGKTNTATVMSADSGKYVTNDSNGQATIWYSIKEMRDNKIAGCDDWFVPSKAELEELRKAIGFVKITTSDDPVIVPAGAVTGGVIAGTADGQAHYKDYNTTRTCYPSVTKFLDSYMWSSSEYSAQRAWNWYTNSQIWTSNDKNITASLCAVRAF